MLFCNFMRINPQLVVQKLPGHGTNTPFQSLWCHFLQVGCKHSKFWEKIKWPHLVSAQQDFLDLGKITFSYSGFSCSTWTQNIEVRGLLTAALFHISWILVQKDTFINSYMLVQFSYMAGTSQLCNPVRECWPITFVTLTQLPDFVS